MHGLLNRLYYLWVNWLGWLVIEAIRSNLTNWLGRLIRPKRTQLICNRSHYLIRSSTTGFLSHVQFFLCLRHHRQQFPLASNPDVPPPLATSEPPGYRVMAAAVSRRCNCGVFPIYNQSRRELPSPFSYSVRACECEPRTPIVRALGGRAGRLRNPCVVIWLDVRMGLGEDHPHPIFSKKKGVKSIGGSLDLFRILI